MRSTRDTVRDLLGLADDATVDRFIAALAGGDALDGIDCWTPSKPRAAISLPLPTRWSAACVSASLPPSKAALRHRRALRPCRTQRSGWPGWTSTEPVPVATGSSSSCVYLSRPTHQPPSLPTSLRRRRPSQSPTRQLCKTLRHRLGRPRQPGHRSRSWRPRPRQRSKRHPARHASTKPAPPVYAVSRRRPARSAVGQLAGRGRLRLAQPGQSSADRGVPAGRSARRHRRPGLPGKPGVPA